MDTSPSSRYSRPDILVIDDIQTDCMDARELLKKLAGLHPDLTISTPLAPLPPSEKTPLQKDIEAWNAAVAAKKSAKKIAKAFRSDSSTSS